MPTGKTLRSRIVGEGEKAPDQLLANPLNWRRHPEAQHKALEGMLREVGWVQRVIVNKTTGHVVDGHLRVELAMRRGEPSVPVIYVELTPEEEKIVLAAIDPIGGLAETDQSMLDTLLEDVTAEDDDLAEFLDSLRGVEVEELEEGLIDDDEVPEVQAEPVSVRGDVWVLGPHRVMCGDSTSVDDVERLMAGATAQLLHADPPYGMGKEADGVENDNLYREKLDAFQMEWWATYRTFIADNASAYIWGNAPDLWRLWWAGGLGTSEKLELRNEIVWDKKAIPGMASPDLTQFPMATERCLFFQFGNQFIGNVNAEDFPDAWEPLRSYLEIEAVTAGIKPPDIKQACGCGMYSHWFTRSQFTLIPEKHYRTLADAYPRRFLRPWVELKAEWDRVKGGGRDVINGKLSETRSYFDNAHDVMRDVWEFPRVTGEERHGHATPKPVAMVERVMKSSLPKGGLCVEPFGGSGSTLIGAHKTGRVCYSMELQEIYVDVIVRRWQEFTGKAAVLESTGETFDQVEAQRQAHPEAA